MPADDSREDSSNGSCERSSISCTSIVDRDHYGAVSSPVHWENEPQKSFPEKKQGGLQGFAKERNLSIAAPTDNDYESDGSDFSLSDTPGKMKRGRSLKISSFFSRFQRQSTMPNPSRVPASPAQGCFGSLDDISLREESRAFMVSYDSETPVASPKKIISIRGLIKICGRDSCGRPIVVIDTSYCPPAHMRFVALGHIREKMEPLVESGGYNLVFVMSPNPSRADASKDVPAMWCLEVYRKLPYSYKKNVERVVLIHPTFVVNLVISILRPFTSSKSHEKIVRVHRLADLDKASNGEITLDKLYLATHVYLHDKTLTESDNLDNFTALS
ncbi:unnamed protein product [Calypogeia fissa]